MKTSLLEVFSSEQLSFILIADDGVTNSFEVTMRSSLDDESKSLLIHSAKAGQGKCESEDELNAITDKISEFLQNVEAVKDDAAAATKSRSKEVK